MAASVLVVALSAALLAAPASAAGDPAVYQGQATRLYAAYFLRNPDPSGLQFWIARLDAGSSLFTVSQFFSQSQEFRDRYGTLGDPEFVDLVFNNVLGRPAEPDGRAFWIAELSSGRRDRGAVMVGFSESPEFVSKTGTTPPVPAVSFVEFDPATSGVAAQQEKLNALFGPYGFPALGVDGASGRQTSRHSTRPASSSACRSAAPTWSRADPRNRRCWQRRRSRSHRRRRPDPAVGRSSTRRAR